MVRPPNSVINTPLISGTFGIFFSITQTTNTAIIVATISGGIATVSYTHLRAHET